MIQPERVRPLNSAPVRRGDFVLYWMQAAQRAEYNHALEYAVRQANGLGLPLVAFFGLTPDFPGANERHYAFLLEGLKETQAALGGRGVRLAVRQGPPDEGIVRLGRRAALAVTDDGHLRVERAWRARAAAGLGCPLVEVATNTVVPVQTASSKEEYAAATLRPKIYRHLGRFLVPLAMTGLRKDSLGLDLDSLDLGDTGRALAGLQSSSRSGTRAGLKTDRGAGRVTTCRGGTSQARRLLREFLGTKLAGYAEDRNDPALDATSRLSPYLHFGQVSPLFVALEVMKAPPYGRAPFLEELIVRRELAFNFVHYNRAYDRFAGLPDWCRATLREHTGDRREFTYSAAELESGRTHDPYWNAAQKEMVLTGWMHGYMRMYWGKKILEWSPSPERAFRTALALNDRYELDGRDPNGFAGVAWCFGKHDRPWARRAVFGTVRYMNAAGLRRKFDADAYVRKVEALAAAAR
jgi:deoxyribodipyrimidine photo-lyase